MSAQSAERVRSFLAAYVAIPWNSGEPIQEVSSGKQMLSLTVEDLREVLPRTVQHLSELIALPEGAVILDAHCDVWRKYWAEDDTWYTVAHSSPGSSANIKLPAEVLA